MLVSLDTLLQDALKHRYAVPAFNVNFMEQAMAVLDAANETNSPVIIQLSTGSLRYVPKWFIHALFHHAKNSPLPIVIHRDHCHSIEDFKQAIHLGFQSIMVDGTLSLEGKPQSFEDNVAFVNACNAIKPSNICIEGELGCLGSLETGLSGEEDGTQAKGTLTKEQLLTDPDQAVDFVKKTNIHALAIAIGTSHGAYKFTTPPSAKILDIARVKTISNYLPNTPLVLHGSSSIPEDLCNTLNQHGGDIAKTYGVPLEAIQQAIQYGVCKVNIDTDLRLAATAAVRKTLEQKDLLDPRQYLGSAYTLMKAICLERYKAFGSAQQANRFIHHETSTT